ncbi:ABC transporter ATP-binding protein [Nocardia aurantia]|uniref:High-affinity branched-chain amino acid transport ATP-binding protein LivF n=1 Tax=Nocardia aurantia TaxID=2585199 RepID=A0A7K0DZI3_9NOCA|nr:ATP-binding cassette domain-containing protein [Nocardia aurantia]MQY30682.1 High-affinity branched-chain amino acid transport ATP-binding protein LivF [Nocardia aurantia]
MSDSAGVDVSSASETGDDVPAAIAADGLAAGYGAVDVLRAIDLAVRPGEVVALLGPNGAGKTTLLRTLAGYLRPTAGEVRLFGDTCTRLPAYRRCRRGVSFLGEERHIFPGLTVRQSLRLVGADHTALHLFPELTGRMRHRAGLLSGGEQQMLALALALARRPRLLLIDELSLGLAPQVRERLLDAVRATADTGVAVLLVEQNAKAVLARADRAHVLRRGELVDERPAAQWLPRLEDLAALYLS